MSKRDRNYTTMGGVYKKCVICGKSFYMPCQYDWVYRRYGRNGDKYMCSWHCLREYDKEHERKLWVTSNT